MMHGTTTIKASGILILYLAELLTISFYSWASFECSGYSSAEMYVIA